MDTLQVQSLLHRVADVLNSRPLTARSFSAEDFAAVTPRDLLLGCTPMDRLSLGPPGLLGEDTERELPQRIAEVESRVQAWWLRFSEDIFPLLVPRSSWRREQPPLAAGAIVLVKYEAKFGRDRFRLGRVLDVKVDGDGLVRTAWVGVRSLRRAV